MSRLPGYMWSQPGPEMLKRYADALIEIAAAFRSDFGYRDSFCLHCRCHMQNGCLGDCPGLLARRALGVA